MIDARIYIYKFDQKPCRGTPSKFVHEGSKVILYASFNASFWKSHFYLLGLDNAGVIPLALRSPINIFKFRRDITCSNKYFKILFSFTQVSSIIVLINLAHYYFKLFIQRNIVDLPCTYCWLVYYLISIYLAQKRHNKKKKNYKFIENLQIFLSNSYIRKYSSICVKLKYMF